MPPAMRAAVAGSALREAGSRVYSFDAISIARKILFVMTVS